MGKRGDSRRRWPAATLALAALVAAMLVPGAQASVAPAAGPSANASIIGGKIASIADFPSLVFIAAEDKRGRGFACTGTVIAPRVILTAAHCVENLEAGGITPAPEYVVISGLTNPHQAKRGNAFKVASTHVYPAFNPGTLRGDAGLLVLEDPTSAAPIPLASPADTALYDGGATVVLAGWGLMHANSTSEPRRLRSTEVELQSAETCKHGTERYYPVYSPGTQMCTTDPPSHSSGGCFGDSGGPALAQRADGALVEIGVTSTGGPRCSTKQPNVFTRTDRLFAWASGWVAAVESGAPPPSPGGPSRLPLLPTESAKQFVVGALTDVFGGRFLERKALRGRCARVNRDSVKCAVAWLAGPNLYYGTVTVFYKRQSDAVVWDKRFNIRSVNAACWFKSGRQQACPAQTRRG